MKKIIAVLLTVLVLIGSFSLAEDLSALTDRELADLHREVLEEMARRGIVYGTETEEHREIMDPLLGFFGEWAENKLDGMLEYCSSEWKAGSENTRTELFGIMGNRIPLSLEIKMIRGEAEDQECRVDIICRMERFNGKEPEAHRMDVLMKKEEDGSWTVDPMSLKIWEKVPEAEAAEPEPTAEPTAVPEITDETVLYYVPERGSRYHLDPACMTVHEKYLPMQGMFLYSELGDEAYSSLEPCPVCGAPAREE